MISYQAYGIRVISAAGLPELPLSPCPGDDARATLLVRLNIERHINFDPDATFLRTNNSDGQEWLICARSNGGYVMRFVGVADFFVNESGDVIQCCGICDTISLETL